MSTVRNLNESALRGIYDAYMHEAFPPAELKPLAVMLRLMERGRYLCYGYYRNGRLAAYAFFYRHDSRVLLLDYFAVTPELRGRGVGSLPLWTPCWAASASWAKWRCPTAMTPA